MSSKYEITAISFASIFFAMASCTPVNTTEITEVLKCKLDCSVVLCSSPKPCEGTLAPPKRPCECCAQCTTFKESTLPSVRLRRDTEIFVKTLTGKTITLEVESSDTIDTIVSE